jgi:hypothetical protein
VTIYFILLMVILLPVAMLMLRWLQTHRRHHQQTQVFIRGMEVGHAALDETHRLIFSGNALGIPNGWTPGASHSFTLVIDSQTTVDVQVTHEGFP